MNKKEIPDFARKLLNQVAKENGFNDPSIEVGRSTVPGESFASVLYFVTIAEKNSAKKLQVVCKVAPFNKNHRREFCTDIAFEVEETFYNKLLPAFVKLQQEKNVPKEDQLSRLPKCLLALYDDDSSSQIVILEDLSPQGFKRWDNTILLPIENLRLGLCELGKFHGLSIALKDQKPEEFEQFKHFKDLWWTAVQSANYREMFLINLDRVIKSLKKEEHKKIAQHVKDNYLLYVDDCYIGEPSDHFRVINHGDYFHNNILYKTTNEQGVAEDIRILDFQTLRYVSPAQDIYHCIFNSTNKAIRDKEYDNLLAIYYESLSKMVKLLGSDPDKLFTFENLHDELRRYGNYLLTLTPLWVVLACAKPNEIANLDEIFENSDRSNKDLVAELSEKGQAEFNQRINDLLEDIVRLGYYRKVTPK